MTDAPGPLGPAIQIPLVWVGIEEHPVMAANQFLGQIVRPGEIVISVGHVTPPPVIGSLEQQTEQLMRVAFAQVRPIARFGLTESRVRELITMLQQTLDNAERMADIERGNAL